MDRDENKEREHGTHGCERRGGTWIWWTVEKIEFKRREAPKEDRAEPQAA